MADRFIDSTADSQIGGNGSSVTIGLDLTASLDINVQSLQDLSQSTVDGTEAAVTVTTTDPTVSLGVVV